MTGLRRHRKLSGLFGSGGGEALDCPDGVSEILDDKGLPSLSETGEGVDEIIEAAELCCCCVCLTVTMSDCDLLSDPTVEVVFFVGSIIF